MKIIILGTNGMISSFLARYFYEKNYGELHLYGIQMPAQNHYDVYYPIDFLKQNINYEQLVKSDVIIYASGAGVQASVNEKTELMYEMNLFLPIKIFNKLNDYNYSGKFITFGTYMEIGMNQNKNSPFSETQIELSPYQVSNHYALSKRLFTRFIASTISNYNHIHFILPNTFSENDNSLRLIPYTLKYVTNLLSGIETEPLKLSSGNQIRQYINLEDFARVITLSINKNIKSGIYNVGGGETLSIRELISRVFHFYKLSVSDEVFGNERRRDGEIKYLSLDGNKLKEIIGYIPHQKIESIL